MRKVLIFLSVALAVVLCGCTDYFYYGYPKTISFPAEGGRMTIESDYSWAPKICEPVARKTISAKTETEDSLFVTGGWLRTKQGQPTHNKIEIIAEPNNTKQTRTLYIYDDISICFEESAIKVVQYGRK